MSASVILIVVDNPAHRVLLNRYLKNTRHHLVYASDGEDGFDRLGEVKPNLILVHMNVARLDGTILCQLIRQHPRASDIPIILVAEEFDSVEQAEERAASVGADAGLKMPFDRETLLNCMMPLIAFGRPEKPKVIRPKTPLPPITETQEELEPGVLIKSLPDVPQTAEELPSVLQAPTLNAEENAERSGGTAGLLAGVESLQLRSEEVGSEVGPEFKDTTDSTESFQKLGSKFSEDRDLDTVVSFKNPFYEEPAKRASVEPVEPEPAKAWSAPKVDASPPPKDFEEDSPSTDPLDSVDLAPPTPPIETPTVEKAPAEKLTVEKPPVEKPPESKSRPDPLQEPKITETGQHPRPSKSHIIEELPREPTPSAIDEAEVKASGRSRRGLDESQLGKRLTKRVRTIYKLLDEVDYYQLLGLSSGCSMDELKKAHFSLSLEFHPDRFFLIRSGDLKEKIYVIYRRLNEAYRVLSEEALRKAYDQQLESASGGVQRIEPIPAPEAPNRFKVSSKNADAERFIVLAEHAFEEGDLHGARMHLQIALAYEKSNRALRRALNDVAKQTGPAPL